MKLKFDSPDVREERRRKWHTWFAWHPVRVDANTIAWLEVVNRRGIRLGKPNEYPYWKWFYREREKNGAI